MRAQLRIKTTAGRQVLALDATAAPRGGLHAALDWAAGRVRDAYLTAFGLLPGPVAVAVSRATTAEVLPGQYVCRGRVQIGTMRQGEDCAWRREPSSVRTLIAELHTAYA